MNQEDSLHSVIEAPDFETAARDTILTIMYAAAEAFPHMTEVRMSKATLLTLGGLALAEWLADTKRTVTGHLDMPDDEVHWYDAAGALLGRAGFSVIDLGDAAAAPTLTKGGNA